MLQKRDGRNRVYRCMNERFASLCVLEVDSFGGGSVMMFAAISNDLTAQRYRYEIIQPHLIHIIDRQRDLF